MSKLNLSLTFHSLLKIAKKINESPTNEWGGLTFLSKVKKERKLEAMNNYYLDKSQSSINDLIHEHLDLVKKIAWQLHGRVQNIVI